MAGSSGGGQAKSSGRKAANSRTARKKTMSVTRKAKPKGKAKRKR